VVIPENIGVEAALHVFFAGRHGLGEQLSRNWRLCSGRLHSDCVPIVGDLETRLWGSFGEVILQAQFGGAGLVLAIGCNEVRERLLAVSTGYVGMHASHLLPDGARRPSCVRYEASCRVAYQAS
jgi:hypothetical protein